VLDLRRRQQRLTGSDVIFVAAQAQLGPAFDDVIDLVGGGALAPRFPLSGLQAYDVAHQPRPVHQADPGGLFGGKAAGFCDVDNVHNYLMNLEGARRDSAGFRAQSK
jgi:hypothetical protein